jgi:hypothetical protein
MASRHAIWAALLWLALGAAIALAAPAVASARLGLWVGWATAGASSLVALGFLVWSQPKSARSALGVFGFGFVARIVLLAVGLVTALRQGASPIWFAIGYFGTYLPLQAFEIRGALAKVKQASLAPAVGVPR